MKAKGDRAPAAGLVVLFSRVDRDLKAALEKVARAEAKGEAELVRELLAEALAAREGQRPREREKEDRVLAGIESMAARVNDIGISARAAVRLLAHWATQSGAVRVSEDELLAELRAVGKDDWQQAIEEADDARAADGGGHGDGVGKLLK